MSYSQPWINPDAYEPYSIPAADTLPVTTELESPTDELQQPEQGIQQREPWLGLTERTRTISKAVLCPPAAVGAAVGMVYEIAQDQDVLAGKFAFLTVSAIGFAVYEVKKLRKLPAAQKH